LLPRSRLFFFGGTPILKKISYEEAFTKPLHPEFSNKPDNYTKWIMLYDLIEHVKTEFYCSLPYR
jgi:hypothetical protein